MTKKDNRVLVTLDIDTDVYFKLLELCLKERKTIDQVVEEILKSYIKGYEKGKKAKK